MTQPPESTPDQPGGAPTPPSYPSYPAGDTPPPPPPGGYPPPAPGGYGAPQPQSTNQLAMWSMITAILALILGAIGACGVIFGPVALGLGFPARRQIGESAGAQKGAGMATAGIVMGTIGLVLSVVWIVLIATGAIDLPDFASA